jgi:VWFA-related protein
MRKLLFLSVTLGSFVVTAFGQQPTATPPEDQVVRISTDLIQIDVTVIDKNGKSVPGLVADDFEVYENGEKQNLSGAYFMTRSMGGATIGGTPASVTRNAATPGSTTVTQLSPGSVRRTIAIVVDDLNMSFGSIYYARRALRQFVEQQMEPGDLVAIIRTAGAVGALQQFTSDKQLLLAAIESIRWNPLTADADALASVGQTPQDISERFRVESDHVSQIGGQDESGRKNLVHPSLTQSKARDYNDLKNANQFEAGLYAQASLGTMRYLIQGMNDLPGRKVMFLFSDGMQISSDTVKSRSSYVYDMLQELVEFANRSSVVVYTFDTRGLKSMSTSASDSSYEIIDGHRAQKERLRLEDFKANQEGLTYLAKQTGGQALLDSNDLNGGIQRSLDEQSGYYLLAYVPNSESFDPARRRFNKLEVKVRRPGLKVAYRSGFFSTPPASTDVAIAGSQRDLIKALTSPFASNQIALTSNSLFAEEDAGGTYIRSFLHIDAKSLSFSDAPEGWKTATFDIGAVAFGNNGVAVEQKEAEYTIKAKGPTFDAMIQKGFVYVLIVPVKKPGVYQYRVAVRDKATGKIGTAAQIVEVPDLTKRKLTVSSLAVENVSMSIWQNIAAGKVGSGPGQIQVPSTLLYDTVLRQFKAGTVLRYGFEVYNARPSGDSMPKLETQAQILQNNAVVIEGNVNNVNLSNQTDPKHIRVSGAILLKDTLQPGDYLLKLTVIDRGGRQTATQILPFSIAK